MKNNTILQCAGCGQATVKPEQAYLVVYLRMGIVTGHEAVANAEQARRKCLAHVNQGHPKDTQGVTGDGFVHDPDGVFSVGDDQDLDAWAFPVPATVTVDEKRPANEDQIRLYCKFWTTGMGLCGWTGLASEAGWNSHYEEWICPACGATDGIRVVEAEPEARVPPEPPPDDWLEAAYESRTELDDRA
jgi:hypothetical protein